MINEDIGYDRNFDLGEPPEEYRREFGDRWVVTSAELRDDATWLASMPTARGAKLHLYLVEGEPAVGPGETKDRLLPPPRDGEPWRYLGIDAAVRVAFPPPAEAPQAPPQETTEAYHGLESMGESADGSAGGLRSEEDSWVGPDRVEGVMSLAGLRSPQHRESFEEGLEAVQTAVGLDTGHADRRDLKSTLSKIGLLRAMILLRKRWLVRRSRPRITVLDSSFEGSEQPPFSTPATAFPLALGGAAPAQPSSGVEGIGHGCLMAAVVREALGESEMEFRSVLPAGAELEKASLWLGPLGVAWGIMSAVAVDRAEVILVAMSNTGWGTPAYLRRVLEEATRSGPGYPGAVIVCSTGDAFDERAKDKGVGAAVGTDELSAQPWVLSVNATDEDGCWYRRYSGPAAQKQDPNGRFGSAVTVSAPGFLTSLPRAYGQRAVDDTSLACALVGAAAALMRSVATLSPMQTRRLLQQTACLPRDVDPAYGIASGATNWVDTTGHSFKLGYGEINALAALVAASDPVSMGLVLASPRMAPGSHRTQRTPHLLLAQAFLAWCRDHRERHELVGAYLELRPLLMQIALEREECREALLWLGRHLGVVLGHTSRARRWREGNDHSAFALRLAHLLSAFEEGAERVLGGRDQEAVASWVARILPHLSPPTADHRALITLVMRAFNLRRRDFGEE